MHIPLILSQKGTIPEGVVDDNHLVSNGLDLLPTLCDAAGIKCPAGLQGCSLLPLVRGEADAEWRNHVVVESLHGRMLRTDRFKYSIYFSGDNREQLVDLKKDPGERTNLASSGPVNAVLEQHRQQLKDWLIRTGDAVGLRYLEEG